MSLQHFPSIVTDGLVYYHDMSNTQKSWKGAPTTNLLSDYSLSVYNNTPNDITATIIPMSDTYQGATVWQLTITPITPTGVSYLTNGNNPGIGVVTSGGGSSAGVYTGFSIFFRPTVKMYSSPIYTSYSNIPGWQSSNQYDDMGDGWFRAKVIWYDTVTRSDGKYWAINPVGATLNTPIIIYWAGPFKEEQNYSTVVSPYTNSSRSTTQAILDLANNNTVTASNLTYESDGTFSFNGSSNYADVTSSLGVLGSYTICHWSRRDAENRMPFESRAGDMFYQYGDNSYYYTHGGVPGEYYYPRTVSIPVGTWGFYCIVYNGSYVKIYRNGIFEGQKASTGAADWTNGLTFGNHRMIAGYYYQGAISSFRMYNRPLSANEVQQNFNAHKGRYGL